MTSQMKATELLYAAVYYAVQGGSNFCARIKT